MRNKLVFGLTNYAGGSLAHCPIVSIKVNEWSSLADARMLGVLHELEAGDAVLNGRYGNWVDRMLMSPEALSRQECMKMVYGIHWH